MYVSLLTECVEILDGHTTNKRDPSDDINCGAQAVVEQERGEMLLEQHSNSAWILPENGVDETERDGRVRSRK